MDTNLQICHSRSEDFPYANLNLILTPLSYLIQLIHFFFHFIKTFSEVRCLNHRIKTKNRGTSKKTNINVYLFCAASLLFINLFYLVSKGNDP